MTLLELVKDSWNNACENGYEAVLLSYSLEDRVDDMMDYDAIIAEYPREDVLKIMKELFDVE
jgi:hypothetical protein